TIELEVIPACRHFGLGLIPWSPLAGGLLGGVLKMIAGAGLALAATTLGRSGAVMAKPAGQDTPNAPSEA
ncbi:hypothetical protein QIG53_28050, partial [Klebsiella pneumoniae]|nr:hypothetical protein [Klebsiella pneumoniae]